MMLLSLAGLLVISLSYAKAECMRNGVPCLEYTVLEMNEGYEEREYPSIVWVSASAEAARRTDVSRSLIKQLYAYLGGANDRGENIQMVVPVRTKKVKNGPTNTYTMAIPLLLGQGENPPAPSNSNVTVTTEPTTVYVVRAFSGQARADDKWDYHADLLKNAVANDVTIDNSFYYTSAYDSPRRETDRLNEVWMIKRQP